MSALKPIFKRVRRLTLYGVTWRVRWHRIRDDGGYCDPAINTLEVDTSMSDYQQLRILMHEVFHSRVADNPQLYAGFDDVDPVNHAIIDDLAGAAAQTYAQISPHR